MGWISRALSTALSSTSLRTNPIITKETFRAYTMSAVTEDISTKKIKSKKDLLRVRQHVNPLAAAYQKPIVLSNGWIEEAFKDPSLPFHVDIGCAKGVFPLKMAEADCNRNFLGLEIRRSLVEHANEYYKNQKGMENLHYLSCNANVDLKRILTDITKSSKLVRVTIQFPDPHFKKKHHKRRVLKPELVETIATCLDKDGDLFMQGDIFEVMEEMRLITRENPNLIDINPDLKEWMEGPESNPLPVATEREQYVYGKGGNVYRTMFHKKK